MAEATKKRERKTYSVHRLECCKPNDKPDSPDTEWQVVATFESENDAVVARNLLGDTKEWSKYHFSVVREIRQREDRPKTGRKVL